jgi:sortase A
VARLRISAGKPLIVLEGASGRTLAYGPAHDSASVVPGDIGNSLISAHRDTHFAVLRKLAAGDEISTELPGGRRTRFVVTDLRIVDSRRVRIQLDSTHPRLTLITCYPFDVINPHGPLRYIVTADKIS